MDPVVCPYCGEEAKLASGRDIYIHRPDLWSKLFYLCKPCDAYVGMHKHQPLVPLGTLANAELRSARIRTHQAFDPLWEGEGMSRSGAYSWLAGQLGIEKKDCHIGMFDLATCLKAITIAKEAQYD
jgi:hypothetical protein